MGRKKKKEKTSNLPDMSELLTGLTSDLQSSSHQQAFLVPLHVEARKLSVPLLARQAVPYMPGLVGHHGLFGESMHPMTALEKKYFILI